MATGGLYGQAVETVGLYGNSVSFGGTYFEWFIFKESATAPSTPTGGSWNFQTNVGTAPTGWSTTPPTNPTNIVWASIAIISSLTGSTITWTAPATWVQPGTPGTSGYSGISGFSGYSGRSGFSGTNGASGISGYSGSGISGYSGYSGYSGTGTSGYSGYSGAQGASGFSGLSGANGASGTSGFSGYSGYSGSGISGFSGYSGSGISGFSGFSGFSGSPGVGGYLGYWGSFWNTTTQTAAAINTPYAITLNTADPLNTGVSVASSSRVTFANVGVYSITFSIQFTNTSTANGPVQVWLRKNGTDLADTNSHYDVPDKQGSTFSSEILTVNYVLSLSPGDYIQVYWLTGSTTVQIETLAAGANYPRTPSIILTATQVMYNQSGYSGYSGFSGSGISGFSGFSGYSGYSGSGVSGYSGYSGSGVSGFSGFSGISGYSGATGPTVYPGAGIAVSTGSGWGTSLSDPLTGTHGGTGVNNGSNTITVAGNISFAGAFSQTITSTATTAVTLPTSGTLISSTTALSGAVTGTPSSTTYLRGDGTWATVTAGVSQIIAGTNVTISPTGGTGAVTINATGSSNAYTRTSFTATASQTTFSVTYTVGYIEVFLNGVLLNGTDYTATNGTSIVLAVGASSGDIVETIAYSTNAIGTIAASNVTGVLAVANGGTGVSTSTGTGNVVLSTSPTLTTPLLGTPTSGNLSNCTVDGTNAVGFLNIPINSQSTAYTLVLADAGKAILHPSTDANARTFTIPANSSVAYTVGTAITFLNMTSNVVTIAINTDTMYLSSAGTTGSRSLAQYGSATAIKMTSTTWLISGSGLT